MTQIEMDYWKNRIKEFISVICKLYDEELKIEVLCELEEQAINTIYEIKNEQPTIYCSDGMD